MGAFNDFQDGGEGGVPEPSLLKKSFEMKAKVVAALLILLIILVIAWRTEAFQMKMIPAEAKIYSLDGKLLMGIDQSVVGWKGDVLANFVIRAGEILGNGSLPPTHQRTDLKIWYMDEERCQELILQDQSHHLLSAVDDRLLLVRGTSWEYWTGSEFEPLSFSDQAALDARIEDWREAEKSSEWQVRVLNLFEQGTQEVRIGDYVVRASYTEPRVGVFIDDVIELQLLTGTGEVLCSLRETRGLWRRVAAAEFRKILGEEVRIPFPDRR